MMTHMIRIPLSAKQKSALEACARAQGLNCQDVAMSALATVLGPYMGDKPADSRTASSTKKSDLYPEPVPNDLTADFLEDELLRRLAGLPPAPE
jgi:hypothetical protein